MAFVLLDSMEMRAKKTTSAARTPLARPRLSRLASWLSWLSLGTVTIAGCASVGWEEQRGGPVPLNHVENVRANEEFLEGLTARRHEQTLPEPVVSAPLQRQLSSIAEMLQAGQLSVGEAQRASERWGRDVYDREVEAWVLDCGHGRNMPFPPALVTAPAAVISYASAYHHPPNTPSPQCATIVVRATGPVVEKTATPK